MRRPVPFIGLSAVGAAPAPAAPVPDGAAAGTPPPVLILAGRDSTHPDGGGSELYIERIAAGLVRLGHEVTLFCGHYPGAALAERVQGVRVLRRGGRLSVFAHAAWWLRTGRLGRPALIVDVHNGLPFFSRWYTRTPVVVLVHHVHKEQWRVCFGPLVGRLGWWVESRLAPLAYRRARYVTVSRQTRLELAGLGVAAGRIEIVHNGVDLPTSRTPAKTGHPSICVLGRLVPNKRVELALLAVVELRRRHPGLRLSIVGKGYWEPRLRDAVARLGLDDAVDFLGWVDEAAKQEVLARSWVLAMPSLKEGWGLAVMEAAAQGTPAVGFASAGGLAESVRDGETGLLARDDQDFTGYLDLLLRDRELRERLGAAARRWAANFTWDRSAAAFSALVKAVTGAGGPVRPPAALPAARSGARGTVGFAPIGNGSAPPAGNGARPAARPVTIRNIPAPGQPGLVARSGTRAVGERGIEHMGGSA